MNTTRSDSADVVNRASEAGAPVHVISRLLAASEERVRGVLLDPAFRNIWAMSAMLTMIDATVSSDQGVVCLKECVNGHAIDISIRSRQHLRACTILIELRMGRRWIRLLFSEWH